MATTLGIANKKRQLAFAALFRLSLAPEQQPRTTAKLKQYLTPSPSKSAFHYPWFLSFPVVFCCGRGHTPPTAGRGTGVAERQSTRVRKIPPSTVGKREELSNPIFSLRCSAATERGTASSRWTGKNTPPPAGIKLGEGIEFQNNIIGIITQPDEGQPAAPPQTTGLWVTESRPRLALVRSGLLACRMESQILWELNFPLLPNSTDA